MIRTTQEDVEGIMGTQFDSSFDVCPFIKTASLIVDSYVICSSASEAIKTEIEKYLTAHFIDTVTNGGGIKAEKVGEASVTYGFIGGSGFRSTSYGTTALMLDICGSLANLGNSPASIKAIVTDIQDWDYDALAVTVRGS